MVRFLNEEKKVGVDWTFLETDQSSWTFNELAKLVFSGELAECQVKKNVFPCKNQTVSHGFCSTSHQLREEIRGGPNTDLIEKERKFSMLYFTIVVSHQANCEICFNKSETLKLKSKNAFSVLMQSAKRSVEADLPAIIKKL